MAYKVQITASIFLRDRVLVYFKTRRTHSLLRAFVSDQPVDGFPESCGFVETARAVFEPACLVDDQICREAHIKIASAITVGILHDRPETIRHYCKCKGVLAQKRSDASFALHCECDKDNVFAVVTRRELIKPRDLSSADLAGR